MRLLLDTHTLVWAGVLPSSLSATARNLLEDSATEAFVSSASAWEISTKVRLGKWPAAVAIELDFVRSVQTAGYTFLALSVEDGLRAGRFLSPHKDPFDRVLAAQALTANIPILSQDTKLDSFGVHRIW